MPRPRDVCFSSIVRPTAMPRQITAIANVCQLIDEAPTAIRPSIEKGWRAVAGPITLLMKSTMMVEAAIVTMMMLISKFGRPKIRATKRTCTMAPKAAPPAAPAKRPVHHGNPKSRTTMSEA